MRFAAVAAGLLVAGAHAWPFEARAAQPKVVTVTHVVDVYTTVTKGAAPAVATVAAAAAAAPPPKIITVTSTTTVMPTATAAPPAPPAPVASNLPPKNPNPTYAKFIQWTLDHHNVHRANHSAPPLVWDQSLANSALDVAKLCIWKHNT